MAGANESSSVGAACLGCLVLGYCSSFHAAPTELGKLYSEVEAINMALLTELGFARPWFSSFVLPIAMPAIFPMVIANAFRCEAFQKLH